MIGNSENGNSLIKGVMVPQMALRSLRSCHHSLFFTVQDELDEFGEIGKPVPN